MNLVMPEYQPNFPKEDISEYNAEIVQVGLDLDSRFAMHDAVKPQSYLYLFGHDVINTVINEERRLIDQQIATSEGVALYETIASFVRPITDDAIHNNNGLVLATSSELVAAMRKSHFSTMYDARDEFSEKMPRTHLLISRKAMEFLGRDTDYALTGAALAWKLETETAAAA